MRIEEYTRELAGEGFRVAGSDEDWNSHNDCTCQPIRMYLTRKSSGEPYYDNLEDLIKLADSSLFSDGYLGSLTPDFRANYPEIMRGNRPDWQLGAFRVFYGSIQLYYGNTKTKESGFLWITGAQIMDITFEAPRTRLGFNPTYRVIIERNENGSYSTDITEDLGYIRRELSIELKDPNKTTETGDISLSDNEMAYIIEYAGM